MIFLGLGSNIGDKEANLQRALTLLGEQDVQVKRCSACYETAPWGITEQDRFVNLVCEVGFYGEAESLLEIALDVETSMGRQRLQKWGPRLIDIDIIEFNHQQLNTSSLTLPHPFYTQRDFVLVPLSELEPNWVPTGESHSLDYFIQRLGSTGIQPINHQLP